MSNISFIFKKTYSPPEFDSESSEVVNNGESTILQVDGGQEPFDCQIVGGDGTGFTVEGVSNGCKVTAGENATGYIQVQATDNQNNQTGVWSIGGLDCTSCTEITWDDVTSGETVVREDSTIVAINSGACGYYNWSVSGAGFSLQHSKTYGTSNVLNANGSACGSAIITVTDACGNTVEGSVRCTTGSWDSCYSSLYGGCNGDYVDFYDTPITYSEIKCRTGGTTGRTPSQWISLINNSTNCQNNNATIEGGSHDGACPGNWCAVTRFSWDC